MDTTLPSLLVRLKDRQDAAAWNTFDRIYRPMLHRFALSFGLDHADTEDIVQQCMTAVQERIATFDYDREKGKFKSWLRIMMNNKIRNLLRDRKEQPGDSGDFKGLPAREDSPEEVFETLWLEEHLWHCLRLLRDEVEEPTYLAFQHYVIEQWPIEKVCRELNMKANHVYTIKWRLTERIAAKMRELLGDLE